MSRRPFMRTEDSGFVLVGVVMFVLALTILGISLFSLSSFESQFMTRSLQGEQAFNAATSGITRATHRLTTKGILGDVAALAGSDNITSAVAIQVKSGIPDSVGAVVFGGEDVCVRVTATVAGVSRRLESWYAPQATSINIYKRLMALSSPDSSLHILCFDPPIWDDTKPRWSQVRLNGTVWMNSSNTTPCDSIGPPPPPPPVLTPAFESFGGVPFPSLDAYWAARWATATPVTNPGNANVFNLDATSSPDQVHFFKTVAPDPGDPRWSLKVTNLGPSPEINVDGTAIWMFDRGASFLPHVTVKGLSTSLLILVAKPTTSSDEEFGSGISFISSLESQGPGVVLISDGRVNIETDFQNASVSNVPFLTIFAARAQIMGPLDDPPGGFVPLMTLSHPTGHSLDTRLDFLWDNAYLPNATGMTGAALVFRPGSWRQYPN